MLPASGSSRNNYIVKSGDQTFVVTQNDNVRENESFFYFSEVFSELSLNTPQIFQISDDRKWYVQEFLGSKTLSEIIATEGLSIQVIALVQQTLQLLYEMQQKTEGKIDYQKTFEYQLYDELPILNDLFYFKNFFVDVLELPYHKATLLQEFKKLVSEIEHLEPKGLMIRDFQSRNILVDENNNCFFIDYQSAMYGPLMYDVVSFLYQAKANFPENFRQEMLVFYYNLYDDETKKFQLKNSVKPIQLIRNLQVLGAYGFRGLIQRKKHFIASIDQGIENLCNFAKNWENSANFPELTQLIFSLQSEEAKQKIKAQITIKNE